MVASETPPVEIAHSDRLEILTRCAAGGMHDIQNFVTVILGHCEIIKRATAPGTKAHMSAGPVIQAARNIQEIADAVLAFNPNQRPIPVVMDLELFLHDNEVLFRDFLRNRAVLTLAMEPGLPMVMADPRYLKRVIGNLCTNARAAVQDVALATVQVSAKKTTGGMVLLSIADNGCGMDEAARLKILGGEEFTTKTGHTGLGLGVVRSFLAQIGGRLDVESEPGEGSTFVIYLATA